jgi:hypothetical protein
MVKTFSVLFKLKAKMILIINSSLAGINLRASQLLIFDNFDNIHFGLRLIDKQFSVANLIALIILLPSDEVSAPASNYGVNGLQILSRLAILKTPHYFHGLIVNLS